MRTRTKLHIPGAEFKIADLVEDEISGFRGIVITHTRHLTGCDGMWVKSRDLLHEGKPVERYFDVHQLKLIESNPMGVEGFPDDVPASG